MKSDTIAFERRPLGKSGFSVSPVALGCWPIAGVTTLNTNDADSIATIQKCFDVGINHLDTAYVYGPNGESENLIRRAIGTRRDEMVIATKCGIHYEGSEMVTDGRPERLRAECEESLRRLGTDRVELLYLHSPDENVPVGESAGAILDLMVAGKTRSIGVSNFTVEQMEEFSAVCPITAIQPPYNMLLRGIEQRTIPWCRERNIAVMVYWPLMKGILAGKLDAQRGTGPAGWPPQIPWLCRRRMGAQPGFHRSATRSGGTQRAHGGAACRQLDVQPARHHERAVRRKASTSDRRNGRRDGLVAQRRATANDRRSDCGPGQGGRYARI